MTNREALEDLKTTINALSIFLQRSSKKEYQDLKIIEKDLERLEKLEKIIKENFGYDKNALFDKVYFKSTGPVMEEEIIEVLSND